MTYLNSKRPAANRFTETQLTEKLLELIYHLLNAEAMAPLSDVSEETYHAACQKMIRVYDAESETSILC